MHGQRYPVNVRLTLEGYKAINAIRTKPRWKFWADPPAFDKYILDALRNDKPSKIYKAVSLALTAMGVVAAVG